MKPGDKVWVFDNARHKIVSEEVIEAGGVAIVAGHFGKHIGVYQLGFDCFPTREALCEHYRKIFE